MRAAMILAAILLPGGCVLSLHPYYGSGETVAAPAAGNWRLLNSSGAPSQEALWEIDGNRVRVYDDRGRWYRFDVTWFRVGKDLFADTVPADTQTNMSTAERDWFFHMVPFHMVSRVQLDGDRLLVLPLLAEPFNKVSPVPVPGHIQRRKLETLVLDATASDWRGFLRRYGSGNEMFKHRSQLTFVRATR